MSWVGEWICPLLIADWFFPSCEVLPRYGFKKGQVGVMQMLSVGARFNDNEEFCNNRAVLNVPWQDQGAPEAMPAPWVRLKVRGGALQGSVPRVFPGAHYPGPKLSEVVAPLTGSRDCLEHSAGTPYTAYTPEICSELLENLVAEGSFRNHSCG